MLLALHIFRKDARRLWWEIVVTLGLLAALASMDCRRLDAMPSPMEGLFNLMLPLAWAYLVALVVQEEPLVGDTQFWITRPYPWPALLAAKALFVIAFIHLPVLLADSVILSVHQFPPWHYWFQLVSKQALFVLVLTLPAAALATVTRTIAQFLLSAIVILGVGAFLGTSTAVFSRPWILMDIVRQQIALLSAAAAGVAILLLQYARRRTEWARILGFVALLAALALFVYLPREFTYEVRCALSRAELDTRKVSIQLAPARSPRAFSFQVPNREFVVMPISVAGLRDADSVGWEPLALEIADTHGNRWKMPGMLVAAQRPADVKVWAQITTDANRAAWLILSLDRVVYERIKDDRVTLAGRIAATFSRDTDVVRFPIGGSKALVPGAGRCSAVTVTDEGGAAKLKAVCESPLDISLLTRVSLLRKDGGQEMRQHLGDVMPYISYPDQTWLSPLNRRQTFIQLTDVRRGADGSRWLVFLDAAPDATVEMASVQSSGCVIFNYQLRDLALRNFRVK